MGALQIASHSMVQSIEQNSVRKGYDPRDFALVAAGGAGPLFAAQIAAEVGMPAVIVPPYPGVTAAMGLLATDAVYEYVATVYQRTSTLAAADLQTRFSELEEQARAQLEADGVPTDRAVIQRVADCRYLGQGYELRIDCDAGDIDDAWIAGLSARFHDAHEREYARRLDDSDIEVPNIRVRGIGLMPALKMPEAADAGPDASGALRHEQPAWFQVDGELRQVPTLYYDRAALEPGNEVEGPAVISQYDSTTVVPPGFVAVVDRQANILVRMTDASEAMVSPAGTAGAVQGG
jgi:5-oxoprolinase (ATP-hydrolysing)